MPPPDLPAPPPHGYAGVWRGSMVKIDHMDPKDNKVFGLDVEGNNNKYLQEDLKAFIQDYKGKPQHNKACRWILGRCGTGRKKSWKRQRSG